MPKLNIVGFFGTAKLKKTDSFKTFQHSPVYLNSHGKFESLLSFKNAFVKYLRAHLMF